jgi:hypothetical protein
MIACYWSPFPGHSPSTSRERTVSSHQGGCEADGAWSPSSWRGGASRIRGYVARFKENTIACTKLHHANTNPNTKSAAIELDARASRAASTREVFGDESKERPRKSRLEFVDGGWSTILRPGIYNYAVLDFRRIRQALCIALSVFLCKFLLALPLLCENGGAYVMRIAGSAGHQERSWLARWVRWEMGAAAGMKV